MIRGDYGDVARPNFFEMIKYYFIMISQASVSTGNYQKFTAARANLQRVRGNWQITWKC